MNYVISHNFAGELTRAVRGIGERGTSETVREPAHSPILVHPKCNCGA